MRRVDYIGAPGVGKSTLHKFCIRHRSQGAVFIPPDKAKVKMAKEYLKRRSSKDRKETIAGLALNNLLFKPLHVAIADKVMWRAETDVLWRNRGDYNAFVDQVLLFLSIDGVDAVRKGLAIDWFMTVLKTVAALDYSRCSDTVLMDESLSQKMLSLISFKKDVNEGFIKKYFELMPLPDGLVYCYLETEKIVERLKNRHKTIIPHRDVTDDELVEIVNIQGSFAALGAGELRKRGVPVLDLDMSQSLAENCKLLDRFVRGFA